MSILEDGNAASVFGTSTRYLWSMPRNDSPGARLLRSWRALAPLPGGRWLFTQLVKWTVPYTGSVNPRVEALEPGYARVSITQRRRLEQHLGSIHAIALANVAEFASGAAMTTALPAGFRGIVTKFTIEYFKKARGTVTAESRPVLPDLTKDGEHDFVSEVKDESGAVVARAVVTWRLGPDVRARAGPERERSTVHGQP